jgi:cytochrome c oxidase assembly protein subunit 15
MHLLGIVVAGSGSLVRCLGWPVWRIVASDESPALQWARIVLGVVAAAMLVWIMVRAWRRPALRRTVVALAIAFVVELAAGQFIVGQFTGEQARNLGFAALYSMLAGTIVWLIALLASRAGRPSVPSAPAAVPQAPARSAS